MKRAIAHLLGRSLFASRLDEVLLRNAAVVVAFHRVHDGAAGSDPLTVGVRQFEHYCEFFRRHFRVVALPDLVDRLVSGRPLRRRLAITFDDGYRDNFDNAAPVLERLALPATFFLATQLIGTEVVPWWDKRRGLRFPWMTWNQVRTLHRKGFDIGCHTQTHVDLGKTAPDTAWEEIVESRLDLEQQLAGRVESFAYPYGGRDNLTAENRELVKAAGFRCCCSAFGGTNGPETDPFHLQRIPISPAHASPHHFGFDVAVGRSFLPA
jgi:peptidoglycan/xylan/chitin deacetylase (PgdA/CDA1 family)